MSIELLGQNIEREKQIVTEIYSIAQKIGEEESSSEEKQNADKTIEALAAQLKILNKAVPELIKNISFYKNLESTPEKNKIPDLVNVKYTNEDTTINLAIKKKDEEKFLEHLSMGNLFKKKSEEIVSNENDLFGAYMRFSNKLFKDTSEKLVAKGYFNSVKLDLRKISSLFMVKSYVSVMLFSTIIAFFAGLFFSIILLATKLIGLGFFLLILFGVPIIVFGMYYIYPSSRRKSLEKDINQELPFLTIYMAAVATSGIEPSKIFSILVNSKDYPFSKREIKKLMNYINFYGYDLVSAMKTVSKSCPSERLALLFDGMATTITSGGELTSFLSKHSDTLLFDYRLEREKYTRTAETFMNIYISIVIAAPMIMMMLFILMSLLKFGEGFLTTGSLSFLAVLVISLLNLGFIVFLNMKQPKF